MKKENKSKYYPIYYVDDKGDEFWMEENKDGSVSVGSSLDLEEFDILKRLIVAIVSTKQKYEQYEKLGRTI